MGASISFLARSGLEPTTFKRVCEHLIDAERFHDVCEIGGGRTPLFSIEEIRQMGANYTILDISAEELDAAPDEYNKVCADICDGLQTHEGMFDFAFSIFMAEHVRSGEEMHRSIHGLLRPGGIACHLFPTLFSPVFVLNWMLPKDLSGRISNLMFPNKRKFPAKYSWCFGPTKKMIGFLKRSGFEIREFRAFYGSGYFSEHPLLDRMDVQVAEWARKRRNPYLSSYALIILQKPYR